MTSQDLGTLLIRLALGIFFASSGYHKLFVGDVRAKFIGLFQRLGCYNRFTIWAVPGGELLGGLGLIWGLATPLAAAGLILILAGAIYLDTGKELVAKHPRDVLDWCAKAIYMPEGFMVLALVSVALAGGGPLSTDHYLAALIR